MSQHQPLAVPYVNLAAQIQAIRAELLGAAERVFSRSDFILGADVTEFEANFALLCGTRHAVAVANGTDALILALKAVGIGTGDEVITASNSFIASAAAIALIGGKPVFVDVREDMNIDPASIEAAITPRTRAIEPVHLTGRPCDMAPIMEIAHKRSLHVIEDASQAVGAAYRGQKVGSFGAVNCFSLHPLKNLNALGDGGVITTNDASLADNLRKSRNHGLRNRDESEFWGHNSRLDTLQAAFLNAKLKHLTGWTEARRQNAAFYRERLHDLVVCPDDKPFEYAIYHTFVIQAERRDELQTFLLGRGIETKIHYPIPIHLQPAARALGYRAGSLPKTEQLARKILSLPIYPELTVAQKEAVVSGIRGFYGK
jgi:dTDP-4-amino-4,6-dideoxygalactose transaminase